MYITVLNVLIKIFDSLDHRLDAIALSVQSMVYSPGLLRTVSSWYPLMVVSSLLRPR